MTTTNAIEIKALRQSRKTDPTHAILVNGSSVASVWSADQAERGVEALRTMGDQIDYAALRVVLFG